MRTLFLIVSVDSTREIHLSLTEVFDKYQCIAGQNILARIPQDPNCDRGILLSESSRLAYQSLFIRSQEVMKARFREQTGMEFYGKT